MTKMTPLGRLVCTVVVGVVVGAVGMLLLLPQEKPRTNSNPLKWEYLEGVEGTDLQRLQTPQGWIVEGADGYLVVMDDPEHEWLAESE
jgi:hypothetical protein